MDFEKWYDLHEEELGIAAAESGADREFGYDSERMMEDAYQEYLKSRVYKDYGVSWELDVNDESPLEAAKAALEEMKKVDARTLTFHVTDLETGKRYEVDLSADAGEEVVEL